MTVPFCVLMVAPVLSNNHSLFGGRLAQLVEHSTFNRTVVGSNPTAPTTPSLSKACILIASSFSDWVGVRTMDYCMKHWQLLNPMDFIFAEANGYAIHARTPQANYTKIKDLSLLRA